MTEILRTGASVTGAIGLLGLIACALLLAYFRFAKSQERRLLVVPENDRADLLDGSLKRYGLDAKKLSRPKKVELLLAEMDKNAKAMKLKILVAAGLFAICFCVAIFAPPSSDAQASVKEYKEYVAQVHANNLDLIDETVKEHMQEEPDSKLVGELKNARKVLDQAKANLDQTIENGHLVGSAINREQYKKVVDEIKAIPAQNPNRREKLFRLGRVLQPAGDGRKDHYGGGASPRR